MPEIHEIHWLAKAGKTVCGENTKDSVFTWHFDTLTCVYCRIGVETDYRTSQMPVGE